MKVKQIEIVRAEGPIELCGRKQILVSFRDANSLLAGWAAQRARDKDLIGYDKCDFRLIFDDGSEYAGRYDLYALGHTTDEGTQYPNLLKHVSQFIDYLERTGEHVDPCWRAWRSGVDIFDR